MTYKEITQNETINTYILQADASLKALGYTEHSFAHVKIVSSRVEYILKVLGYSDSLVELGMIAAYLHDIGNLVNRVDHSQSGAIIAFRLLSDLNFKPCDIATITTAIGNHDEGTGVPVSPLAAALILADKSDVRRSRVRNDKEKDFDIHDRVNYSVAKSELVITDNKEIELRLLVDTTKSSVMEYFEIFLQRMILCKKAAEFLNLNFKLFFNDQQMI